MKTNAKIGLLMTTLAFASLSIPTAMAQAVGCAPTLGSNGQAIFNPIACDTNFQNFASGVQTNSLAAIGFTSNATVTLSSILELLLALAVVGFFVFIALKIYESIRGR